MKIYFVTSNNNKFAEAHRIVDCLVKKPIEIEEIQSMDVEKVTLQKLKEAYARLRKPVVVEDTGLHLRAMNGFPGALIKHMEQSIGVEAIPRLLSLYGNMEAEAETAVGLNDGKRIMMFVSVTRGWIARRPRGRNGFGFDSVFVPVGSRKTLGQMSIDEKNLFSARGKSFRKLKTYLMKR